MREIVDTGSDCFNHTYKNTNPCFKMQVVKTITGKLRLPGLRVKPVW